MPRLKDILFERDENDTNNTGGVLYCYSDNKFLLCKLKFLMILTKENKYLSNLL